MPGNRHTKKASTEALALNDCYYTAHSTYYQKRKSGEPLDWITAFVERMLFYYI